MSSITEALKPKNLLHGLGSLFDLNEIMSRRPPIEIKLLSPDEHIIGAWKRISDSLLCSMESHTVAIDTGNLKDSKDQLASLVKALQQAQQQHRDLYGQLYSFCECHEVGKQCKIDAALSDVRERSNKSHGQPSNPEEAR